MDREARRSMEINGEDRRSQNGRRRRRRKMLELR